MMRAEKRDTREVDGAEKLAIRIVMQALVESVVTSDPDMRQRIIKSLDEYVLKLAPQSKLEEEFCSRARSYVELFIAPPDA